MNQCVFTGADLNIDSVSISTSDLNEWGCSRQVWEGHDGVNDRCVWHANTTDKPPAKLEDIVEGDDLHGAIGPSETDLTDISFPDKPRFIRANLSGVNLQDADLSGTSLRQATLDKVGLNETTPKNVEVNEGTTARPPSLWEQEADEAAESRLLTLTGFRRLRALRRAKSDSPEGRTAVPTD